MLHMILGVVCGMMVGAFITLPRHLGKPRCQHKWLECPATYVSVTLLGILGGILGVVF